LAYSRLGIFRNEGDRVELAEEYQKSYKEKLVSQETKYGIIHTMKVNPRKDRATKILKSLSVMRGGAKQAQFGTPVHPHVLILAGLTSGNLIFNNIFEDSPNGPKIKIETLEEVLKDYTPRLASNIYIGIRAGYLEPENEKKLRKWVLVEDAQKHKTQRQFEHTIKENGHDKKLSIWNVVICTPLEAASKISEELPT
jgi:CRISPR-associated protein Cst2